MKILPLYKFQLRFKTDFSFLINYVAYFILTISDLSILLLSSNSQCMLRKIINSFLQVFNR